ncbi:transglycosylase SLT domain-containing protein [Escherichia coli]|uniref:transglycosylase SLT domain-containing protein n=1 Tax=Escherichia coli TaxID=562 RepID=UPI00191994AD|nr:transglycosylase SLT domain-containing protein [Escherichia coli]CAD5570370.1 putative transglycosylase [Escherichia coli]
MKNILLTGLLTLTSPVIAQDCFEMAGRDYRIDPDLLRAISFRESSWRDNALNIVSQNEYAVGKMQIHSQNFSHLAQFGITPQQLYTDSCLNIYTGAYYLAIAFKKWGISWEAVGAYNAGFRRSERQNQRRLAYASDIYRIYAGIKSSKGIQLPVTNKPLSNINSAQKD